MYLLFNCNVQKNSFKKNRTNEVYKIKLLIFSTKLINTTIKNIKTQKNPIV